GEGQIIPEPPGVRGIEDALGKIQPAPTPGDRGGGDIGRPIVAIMGPGLYEQVKNKNKKADGGSNVNEHGHLCKNFDNSRLKRFSSRATAPESPATNGDTAITGGMGASSQRDTIQTKTQNAEASGAITQRT